MVYSKEMLTFAYELRYNKITVINKRLWLLFIYCINYSYYQLNKITKCGVKMCWFLMEPTDGSAHKCSKGRKQLTTKT